MEGRRQGGREQRGRREGGGREEGGVGRDIEQRKQIMHALTPDPPTYHKDQLQFIVQFKPESQCLVVESTGPTTLLYTTTHTSVNGFMDTIIILLSYKFRANGC